MSHRENENTHELDCSLSPINLLAEAQRVPQQVVDRTIARGRRLRSDAYLHLLAAIARGFTQLVKRTRHAYRCRRDARYSEQVLRGLDGHLRSDIGIDGHQIPVLARCPEEEAEGGRDGRTQLHKFPVRDSRQGVGDDECVGRAA